MGHGAADGASRTYEAGTRRAGGSGGTRPPHARTRPPQSPVPPSHCEGVIPACIPRRLWRFLGHQARKQMPADTRFPLPRDSLSTYVPSIVTRLCITRIQKSSIHSGLWTGRRRTICRGSIHTSSSRLASVDACAPAPIWATRW